MTRRTALMIAVPEAEAAVGALRLAGDWSAARGVPAHVTLLFPFAPPDAVDEPALGDLFAQFAAFDFTLDRVERFEDGATWLHPEPSWRFAELTAAIWQRWPGYPPYEGLHDEVMPHLTVSDEPVDVDIALPIACRAHEVHLIEEQADEQWRMRAVFPLS
jgi:2'-5' RNA ligase